MSKTYGKSIFPGVKTTILGPVTHMVGEHDCRVKVNDMFNQYEPDSHSVCCMDCDMMATKYDPKVFMSQDINERFCQKYFAWLLGRMVKEPCEPGDNNES